MTDYPHIERFGDYGLLLQWTKEINPEIHNQVLTYKNYIECNFNHQINCCVASYQSLAIYCKKEKDVQHIHIQLQKVDAINFDGQVFKKYTYQIPVCYNETFGTDLENVAKQTKLTVEQVIKRHSQAIYTVYFIGFLPGFPYLGGLDTSLQVPRKSTPEGAVPGGTVAIGGQQTGIYPVTSPGGWHSIGKTPVKLFDISRQSPSLLKAGDKVVFKRVSKAQYLAIDDEIKNNHYTVVREEVPFD